MRHDRVVVVAGKLLRGKFPVSPGAHFVDATNDLGPAFAAIKQAVKVPGHLTKIVEQCWRLQSKTSEDEALVALHPGNGYQPPLRLVEFAMIAAFEIRRGYQVARGIIGPAVERTKKRFCVPDVRPTDAHPAVPASIEQGLDQSIALPPDQDPIGAD